MIPFLLWLWVLSVAGVSHPLGAALFATACLGFCNLSGRSARLEMARRREALRRATGRGLGLAALAVIGGLAYFLLRGRRAK